MECSLVGESEEQAREAMATSAAESAAAAAATIAAASAAAAARATASSAARMEAWLGGGETKGKGKASTMSAASALFEEGASSEGSFAELE